MRNHTRLLAAVLLLLASASVAAQQLWSTRGEAVAIQGYDPVAYFLQREAVKGKPEFFHPWGGTTWFFASAENRAAFAGDPEKYAPQYGGFCALSVANGRLARGSGEAWFIHDGRLYLHYDKDIRARWARDIPGNIQKAHQEWARLKGG